jgi:hypothetical protein
MKRLLIVTLMATLAFLVPTAPADGADRQSDVTVTFDVAFDGRTYRGIHGVDPFATNPPDISRGDTFILDGKIFPAGTIPAGDSDFGPDTPGGIGKFYCRGTFLYNFEEIAAGAAPIVNSTQHLELTGGSGLVTEGLEGNVPTAVRAVIGGFGDFAGASGQLRMEVLGANPTHENNWRFTFTLKKKLLK